MQKSVPLHLNQIYYCKKTLAGSSLCEQLQCIIKVVKNKARNGGASSSHVHPGQRFDILSQPVHYQVHATVSGHQQLLMLALSVDGKICPLDGTVDVG